MKKYLLLVCLSTLAVSTFGQTPYPRYTIQKTFNLMTLDAPDARGLHQSLRVDRHLVNDRLVIAASIGYLKVLNRFKISDNVTLEGRPRLRLTTDLTLLVDLLKSQRFGLRLGGGPSVWARRDDVINQLSVGRTTEGDLVDVVAQRTRTSAVNFGYHFTGEFEAVIFPRVFLSAHVALANLKEAGYSSIAGVGIGYQFR
jgi:hypothetical protein